MELTFGDGIAIEDSAFQGCTGLTSINFQGDVAKIREKSFKDCNGLEYISTIHAERIESYAFDRCTNLKSNIVISSKTKYIGDFLQLNQIRLIIQILMTKSKMQLMKKQPSPKHCKM
ncbi:hypothetical protein M9Y10_003601 [Tritrichomonas musculus]|uniref:Surface antigen BspA-like n=1 Tax=Tritrichomonas musculus TaxID=1915356 RepID=A0ABR2JPV2_9EUKA